MGKETSLDVEISWPSGKKETYQNLPSDFIYTLTEGEGIAHKAPFSGHVPADVKR
jgi:hypothetical protein